MFSFLDNTIGTIDRNRAFKYKKNTVKFTWLNKKEIITLPCFCSILQFKNIKYKIKHQTVV